MERKFATFCDLLYCLQKRLFDRLHKAWNSNSKWIRIRNAVDLVKWCRHSTTNETVKSQRFAASKLIHEDLQQTQEFNFALAEQIVNSLNSQLLLLPPGKAGLCWSTTNSLQIDRQHGEWPPAVACLPPPASSTTKPGCYCRLAI